jgi:23S rRNA (uracil1939-C5)-methyltransferase
VEPSPDEFGYRNRLTFTLKRIGRDRVVAGFHAWEEPGRITEVWDECLLPQEGILAAWTQLRAGWAPAARRLPGGRELRLTLRAVDEGVVLAVDGGRGTGSPDELLAAVPALVSLWHRPEGGEWRHVAGEAVVHDRWFGEPVALEGAAFLQVNRALAESLHLAVLKELGNPRGLHVVDGYAGVGLYARRLARHGARVTAIESDAGAVGRGRVATADEVTWVEGRVEDTLADALPAERLIVNPPRSGLADPVPPLLRERPVPRIVYVSCDPATLARDLKRLGDAYTVRRVHGFDLFPQTAHVETMVTLDAADPDITPPRPSGSASPVGPGDPASRG